MWKNAGHAYVLAFLNVILNRSYLSHDSESGDVGLERRVPKWAVYLIYDEKRPVTVVG